MKTFKYVDLFCGIGGFRFAMQAAAKKARVSAKCVFSCDIDEECQNSYRENFGETPHGDITALDAAEIPNHDILLAGFPCQPFSIIGHLKGFEDARGTLFFDIARILQTKKPKAFVLENVKLLKGHDHGRTLQRIIETVKELGYECDYGVLNALHFGLPQKRERIFIVGTRKAKNHFELPIGDEPMRPLKDILEDNVPKKFFASSHIRASRREKVKGARLPKGPNIWHENKGGNIGVHPFSCALRAGASYNYLLVDGKRRLTPREMLRLQGFPEKFKIVCNDSQTRKQAGNSLPVPVASRVLEGVFHALGYPERAYQRRATRHAAQTRLLEKEGVYSA
ncbi:MAG: DNA (cytosine-5-)-methyltransferase [Alphaproteobacteria bacterium]|nr:DNA (cytosine-5-)-methyltransferase [Alphaproteobacteria bacterium]